MKTYFLFFCVIFLLRPETFSQTSKAKLPEGVIAISGPGPQKSDFQFIDQIAQSQDMVVLANCLHGSQNADLMISGLMRHLYETQNFRTIFFEWGTFFVKEIQKIIDAGQCESPTFAQGVANFLGPDYQTVELVQFFKNICQFNSLYPNQKIKVAGFDTSWEPPFILYDYVEAVLKQVNDPIVVNHLAAAESHCIGMNANNWSDVESSSAWKLYESGQPRDPVSHRLCNESLIALIELSNKNEVQYRNLFGDAKVVWSKSALRNLQSMEDVYAHFNGDFNSYEKKRDFYQAENLKDFWSLYPNDRALFWGATLHAAKKQSDLAVPYWNKIKSNMQYTLENFPQKKIHVMGMTGYQLQGIRGNFLLPTSPESIDWQFHQLGYPYLFTKSDSPYIASRPEWFTFLENSAGRPDGLKMKVNEQYDSLLYIDYSPPSTPFYP